MTAASPAAPGAIGRAAGQAGGVAVLGDLLALLWLVPLAAALVASFSSPASATEPYRLLWGTPDGWAALGRTMAISSLAAALALLLGSAVARWAGRLSHPAAVQAALLSCLPLLLPSSLLASSWIVALGRQGVLTRWLGGEAGMAGWTLFSWTGSAGVLALRYFGPAAVILTAHGLRARGNWPARRAMKIPRLLAAWHLSLRPWWRPAVAAWLLVALLCMNDHTVPDLLLVSTYGTRVLILYSALMDLPGAAAMAAPPAALGAAMIAAALWIAPPAWELSPQQGQTPPPRSGFQRAAAVVGVTVVLLVALGVPAAVLAWRAGSGSLLTEAFRKAKPQAWQTLQLASAGGLLCALLGAVLAAGWRRARLAGRRSLCPLVFLNLTVSPSLLAIGVTELTLHGPLEGLRGTSWPLVLAYGARFLPVAVLVLMLAWRDESDLPDQAAAVHGVPGWRRLVRIRWPARRLGLAAAAVVCALLAGTELEASTLLAAPGRETLGVRLATMLHTAPEPLVSALALDIQAMAAPGMALAVLLAAAVCTGKGDDSCPRP